MASYAQKLRDYRWKVKRVEILERDEYTCQVCKYVDNEFDDYYDGRKLHVHHKRYDRSGNPWDSPNDDLITLCEGCHDVVEHNKDVLAGLHMLFPNFYLSKYDVENIEHVLKNFEAISQKINEEHY